MNLFTTLWSSVGSSQMFFVYPEPENSAKKVEMPSGPKSQVSSLLSLVLKDIILWHLKMFTRQFCSVKVFKPQHIVSHIWCAPRMQSYFYY